MPIEIGIWKLGPKKLERVPLTGIDAESRLENSLVSDLSILSPRFLLLGRQVATANGKFIDILAIDQDGNLIVIELKKDRTPRDVVAQVLDYASWVQSLSFDEISVIYAEKHGGAKLEAGFQDAFGRSLPQEINQEHELIVVASELDPSTERIISYLSENYGVPVNAVFFRYFRDNGAEYLARSWPIDPQEAEAKASRRPSTRVGSRGTGATSTCRSARTRAARGTTLAGTGLSQVAAGSGLADASRTLPGGSRVRKPARSWLCRRWHREERGRAGARLRGRGRRQADFDSRRPSQRARYGAAEGRRGAVRVPCARGVASRRPARAGVLGDGSLCAAAHGLPHDEPLHDRAAHGTLST